jgi:cation diffusion facilitator CzcD-associated flavoprotein CzcO
MTTLDCHVAIIGAGPYGLSAAAHLRAAGVETFVLGDAMAFWREQMPRGMMLRSPWPASHIAAPRRNLTLERYQAAQHVRFSAPVPLEHFVGYGEWFQRHVVPDLDPRRVERVERNGRGFLIRLDDESTVHARRVVVAAGIAPFAYRPHEFDQLPRALVSHASDRRAPTCTRFGRYSMRRPVWDRRL